MSDATASAAPSVAVAARAAVDFLLAARSSSGESSHWTDFMLPAGASDLWVTAFVGGVLARSPDAEAHAAAEAAWLFLAERASAEGGWGYNTNVPADADSTLWGLRLGAALGVSECPAARRARAFLDRHRHPDGGLATYASADAVRAYLGLPQGLSFAGWTASHGCVTAAGANLPARARACGPRSCVTRPPTAVGGPIGGSTTNTPPPRPWPPWPARRSTRRASTKLSTGRSVGSSA